MGLNDLKLSSKIRKIEVSSYQKEKSSIIIFIIIITLLTTLSLLLFSKTDQIKKIENENHSLKNAIYSDLNSIDSLNKKLQELKSAILNIKNDINENKIKHLYYEKEYQKNSKTINSQNNNINSLILENKKKKIELKELISSNKTLDEINISYPQYLVETYQKQLNDLNQKYKTISKNKVKFELGESLILSNSYYYYNLTKWIFPDGYLIYNLVYSSVNKTISKEIFQSIFLDYNLSNILIVILTEDDEIIGGFTYIENSKDGYRNDKNTFLFNLSKGKRYLINDSRRAFFFDSNNMITFGTGYLTISNYGLYINFPSNYGDNSAQKNEITNGKSFVKIKIIEIFYLNALYDDIND